MKILFLALYPPIPPVDGGRIRTFNILKQISLRHEVSLFCFEDSLSLGKDQVELKAICNNVFVFPKPEFTRRGLLRKIFDLFRVNPISLKRWWSPEMEKVIRDEISSSNYDIIHIDHILLAQYANSVSQIPWILTHHNIESLAQIRQQALLPQLNSIKNYFDEVETYRWKRYEIVMSRKASGIITVSESEANYFRRVNANSFISVVPNGVDLDYFSGDLKNSETPIILFTGRMDYLPNVDGVIWFCREIFPRIRAKIPDVEFLIVGRDPTLEVKNLISNPGVTVTGAVDDVRIYYRDSSVFVVPLRSGGGTRLKILEAMAMCVPVVSTSIGSEGLDFIVEKEIIVTNDPGQFAEKVLWLLQSPEIKSKICIAAKRKVKQIYDWRTIFEEIENVYETCISL